MQKWGSVCFQGECASLNVWHISQHVSNHVRYRVGFKRPPIGNHMLQFQWSHDQWRHVTSKGQGHDPKIFEAPYPGNCARWTVGSNWSPIGYWILRVQRSRDWWFMLPQKVMFMASKSLTLHISTTVHDDGWFNLIAYSKPCIISQVVTWLMTACDPCSNSVRVGIIACSDISRQEFLSLIISARS